MARRITKTLTFSPEGLAEMARQAEAEHLTLSRYLERLVWAEQKKAGNARACAKAMKGA